jgi:hypothetical protein
VYFLDALNVLMRRWYLVLLGTILVAIASVAAMSWVPTSYQASGQVLLILPSEASGAESPTNPYLNLQDGMTTTASLVAGTLATRDTARDLARNGYRSEYAIALQPDTGPLLAITATDTDPQAALATRDEVIRQVDVRLDRMQSDLGIPDRLLIRGMPTAVGERAEVLPGSKVRALAVIVAGGMTLTLLLTFAFDRLRGQRRREVSGEDEPTATEQDQVVGPPPKTRPSADELSGPGPTVDASAPAEAEEQRAEARPRPKAPADRQRKVRSGARR